MENKVTPYCMGCGRIKLNNEWQFVINDVKAMFTLSHGYCDDCADKAIEDAKQQVAQAKLKTYKIGDIGVVLCRNCGYQESPNKMKDGLCVFCQKCSACGKTECEKTLNRDSGSYFCDDCHDSTLTIAERKQRNMEALI